MIHGDTNFSWPIYIDGTEIRMLQCIYKVVIYYTGEMSSLEIINLKFFTLCKLKWKNKEFLRINELDEIYTKKDGGVEIIFSNEEIKIIINTNKSYFGMTLRHFEII